MDMDQLEEEDEPFITVAHHQFPAVVTCELDKAIKKFEEMEKDFEANQLVVCYSGIWKQSRGSWHLIKFNFPP